MWIKTNDVFPFYVLKTQRYYFKVSNFFKFDHRAYYPNRNNNSALPSGLLFFITKRFQLFILNFKLIDTILRKK